MKVGLLKTYLLKPTVPMYYDVIFSIIIWFNFTFISVITGELLSIFSIFFNSLFHKCKREILFAALKAAQMETTLFQRSYNVIWTLDGQCFDIVSQLGV